MTSSVLNFMSIYGGTYQLLDGYAIPRIGLGTYTLWSQSDVDYAVDAALSSGYRLFDTANFYQNENELGNSFKVWIFCININNDSLLTYCYGLKSRIFWHLIKLGSEKFRNN